MPYAVDIMRTSVQYRIGLGTDVGADIPNVVALKVADALRVQFGPRGSGIVSQGALQWARSRYAPSPLLASSQAAMHAQVEELLKDPYLNGWR